MELELIGRNPAMGFRRGDIVWARVAFPDKWWPGLVQSTHGHRVAVSFFDDAGKSRYFLETEVRPFEENFGSLAKTVKSSSRGGKLLEFALALVARRAAYGLRCRCHFRPLLGGGSGANRSKIGYSFRPGEVLDFVAGLAVSPVVGDSDFVGAVTLASQVNVFRRFMVVEQKLLHQKATGSCSVAKSLDVPEMGTVRAGRQDDVNLTFSSCERSMEDDLLVPVVTSDPPLSTPQEAQQSKSASIMIDRSRGKQKLLVKASRHERTDAVFCSGESSKGENSESADFVKNVGQDRIKGSFSSKESCFIDLTVDQLLVPLVASSAPSSIPQEAQQSKCASIIIDHSRDKQDSVKASMHDRIDALFCSERENNSQSADTSQMEHSTSIGNHEPFVKDVGQDRIEGTFSSKDSCSVGSIVDWLTRNHVDGCRDSPKIPVKAIGRKRVDLKSTSKESPAKKSKVDKQLLCSIYGSCQKLYMKFPRDFKLPSKMDLIKKFRRYGQIDLVRTKVFERMGSAQVVFVHPFDAMTAYQYAKFKRSLFHGALVLYWLDRYEQKRTHSRFAAPLPKLKPCIKSPYLRDKEEKKPVQKVRFSM